MAGLFGKIFGSDSAIKSVKELIDDSFYTKEERAGEHIRLLKAYEPYHLALRFLMMIITIPYVTVGIGLVISSFWIDVQPQTDMLNELLKTPFTMVNSFYFGNIMIKNLVNKKK